MAAKKSSSTNKRETVDQRPERPKTPRSLAIADAGINTAQQFSALMSAIMSDLLDGSLQPQIANATCNAGGKLLKMVELNQKYGKQQIDQGMKNLQLVDQPADYPGVDRKN